MREPDFDKDGWCLEDGEALHSEAPETFWLYLMWSDARRSSPATWLSSSFVFQ
jgi:hypothetical protein